MEVGSWAIMHASITTHESPNPMYIPDTDDEFEYDGPSRSQLKRDAESLQRLGEALVKLNPQQLATIDMPERLRDAVVEAKRLTSHGGLRRQMQYIGKIMRDTDSAPIQQGLDLILNQHLQSKAMLHRLEQWRDRLLKQGDSALEALLEQHPEADRQRLRQWVRQAEQETRTNKPPRASREIFKYLRELFEVEE